jgi:sodium/bile acid cotransporter 7|tara:strand:- start:21706 stop:22692 length:987 start_codon:yes stop_codon:yes gene_type:complete
MVNFVRANSFVLSLIAAVIFGWLTSEWGAKGGILHTEVLTKLGVVIIFLAQGFGLSSQSLVKGFSNARLHIFTQGWISLGVPLCVLGALSIVGNLLPADLRTALFFLAVLPTTVSSAVALISQADGDVAGGVFNTVLSNMMGVLIVPAAVVWYTATTHSGEMPAVWPIFQKLCLMLLLPLLVGHVARIPFAKWIAPVKTIAKPTTQGIICFIVYAAFAMSFRDKAWETVGITFAFQAFLAASILLIGVSFLVWLSSRWILQKPEERVTAFFCGSQKSLAVGVPYAAAIFIPGVTETDQSAVILPLLFYHPIQLFLGAAILRFRNRLFA